MEREGKIRKTHSKPGKLSARGGFQLTNMRVYKTVRLSVIYTYNRYSCFFMLLNGVTTHKFYHKINEA